MAISLNELYCYIVQNFPGFEGQWFSDENLFINEDGTYTSCGLLAEFSHFYIDNFDALDKNTCKEILRLFEGVVEEDDSASDISSSIKVCFLENISQTKAGDESMVFMGPLCKEFFMKWHKYPL
jgi:hypothetical protein